MRLTWIGLMLMLVLPVLVSCEKNEESVDHTYDRWKERNDSAFHAIYAQAQDSVKAGSPRWRIIRSDNSTLLPTEKNSIVVRIDSIGTGNESPLYTDSVCINYRGELLNGRIFDHSGFRSDYESVFSPIYCYPTHMYVGSNIEGFRTALQYMVDGDLWHIYIPRTLSYKPEETPSSLPKYSMLQFDVQLLHHARRGYKLPNCR